MLALRQGNVKRDRCVVEEVLILVLELCLQVCHHVILPRELLVAFEVVDEVPRSNEVVQVAELLTASVHQTLLEAAVPDLLRTCEVDALESTILNVGEVRELGEVGLNGARTPLEMNLQRS